MRTSLVVMVLVAVTLASVPTSVAQIAPNGIKSCGDMELFIANPDMRDVGLDGKYHVAGNFFMQFQVQGEGASAVETFAFSVGLPPENPEEVCDAPYWPAGLMLESYKADFDKDDGFFILMKTTGQSTPQNTDLTVSVHAYDAAGNEVARFWTVAVAESCPSTAPLGGCAESEYTQNDKLQPWPVLLPGDGSADPVGGVAIDFAEPLSDYTVYLNGDDITAELVEWADRPLWDDDIYWDSGPQGTFGTASPSCNNAGEVPGLISDCAPAPGPAFQWTGRKMTADDVVRVEATDLAGNVAIKEIHMAQAAAGGTLEGGIPILEMTFDETAQVGEPGQTLSFGMTMENTGSGEGHPFSQWVEGEDYPTGWPEPIWDPGHEPVPPKGSSEQTLKVSIPVDAPDGDYQIKPRMDYKQAGVDKSVHSIITVTVDSPEVDPNAEPAGDEVKESPSVGIAIGLLALAGAVAARRRV